jgi:putative solute:sodium symporter small subunit
MESNPVLPPQQRRALYWRRVRHLTLLLLLMWFLVTFGVIFFARELSRFTVFGWPFSFYMAAQGSILFYVIIVAAYAWRMRQLDQLYKGDNTHGQ